MAIDQSRETAVLKRFGKVLNSKQVNLEKRLQQADRDNTGKLTPTQFMRTIKELRVGLTNEEADELLQIAQMNGPDVKINQFCLRVKEATTEKPMATMLPTTSVMKQTQP